MHLSAARSGWRNLAKNMKATTKKARAGQRAWQDLKITLTFTAAEWITLQRDYDRTKAFVENADKSGHCYMAEYTWSDYVDGIRKSAVLRAHFALERAEMMREIERARAAGFNIPDRALRLS